MSRPFGSHRFAFRVRSPACARSASVYRKLIVVLLAVLIASGCSAIRRRGPVPEDVATCRELTQQGVAAMELGDWQQAEKLLQSAVEASPVDATTRHHFAEVLWHRHATDEALLQMEAAVRLDATDASLVVRSGEMLLETGATEKALARADQAIGLNPKLASAWALRGRVYARLGETDRALADLQRSLQFAPDGNDVLMDIATLYRQRGQHDRCLTTLHHLLDTYQAGEEPQLALWMEGLALADLGRPQQAAERLAAANKRGAPNADILYYLAQAEWASGRPEAATVAAQQALAANPGHEPSKRLLVEIARPPAPPGTAIR